MNFSLQVKSSVLQLTEIQISINRNSERHCKMYHQILWAPWQIRRRLGIFFSLNSNWTMLSISYKIAKRCHRWIELSYSSRCMIIRSSEYYHTAGSELLCLWNRHPVFQQKDWTSLFAWFRIARAIWAVLCASASRQWTGVRRRSEPLLISLHVAGNTPHTRSEQFSSFSARQVHSHCRADPDPLQEAHRPRHRLIPLIHVCCLSNLERTLQGKLPVASARAAGAAAGTVISYGILKMPAILPLKNCMKKWHKNGKSFS